MGTYRVVYTFLKVEEELVEADSIDEAKAKLEDEGFDADLFFIEDENGHRVEY